MAQLVGQDDEAISHVRRAINMDPDSVVARLLLGTLFYESEAYPEAIQSIGIAIQLDPASSESYEMRSRVFLAIGQDEEAARDQEMANQLNLDKTNN